MAQVSKHIEIYQHNKEFLGGIDTAKYPDWSITVSFYCCLHKMCACMRYVYNASDENLKNHTDSIEYLKNHNHRLAIPYQRIYLLSRMARYECIDVSGRTKETASLLQSIESICDDLSGQKVKQYVKA